MPSPHLPVQMPFAAGAVRLGLAGRRAAVERRGVAVVAALGAFLLVVAAGGGVAFGDRVARAGPARIPAALGRAGHALDGDPRITRLVAGEDPVAAVGHAGRLDQRADVAALDRAGRRATVAAVGVAVVALLVAFDRAVAAADLRADALHAGDARAARALALAVARAAVALGDVAVVAHLAQGHVDDAIPAARRAHARRSRRRADPALLELAVRAATVARRRVAVVAVLTRLDALVAADRGPDAGAARYASEGGILHRAGGVAAVAVDHVAVVAHLARADHAVAAGGSPRARARRGTVPVRLDVADAVAAVTGDGVAVIAVFDAALVVDAVAAARRNGQRAARSGRATAPPADR